MLTRHLLSKGGMRDNQLLPFTPLPGVDQGGRAPLSGQHHPGPPTAGPRTELVSFGSSTGTSQVKGNWGPHQCETASAKCLLLFQQFLKIRNSVIKGWAPDSRGAV